MTFIYVFIENFFLFFLLQKLTFFEFVSFYFYFAHVNNNNNKIVGQFAEDGSFIGQYVPGKLQPPVSPPSAHMTPMQSSKQQLPNGNGNIGHSSGAIATYV